MLLRARDFLFETPHQRDHNYRGFLSQLFCQQSKMPTVSRPLHKFSTVFDRPELLDRDFHLGKLQFYVVLCNHATERVLHRDNKKTHWGHWATDSTSTPSHTWKLKVSWYKNSRKQTEAILGSFGAILLHYQNSHMIINRYLWYGYRSIFKQFGAPCDKDI